MLSLYSGQTVGEERFAQEFPCFFCGNPLHPENFTCNPSTVML